MGNIAQDDLNVGSRYRFKYLAVSGLEIDVVGRFMGNSCEHGLLWYLWVEDGKDYVVPFSYEDMAEVSLI